MYYSTIEIKPSLNDKFVVHYYHQKYDRESSEGSLSPGLGFYHHPKRMGKEKAFNKLKEAMIKEIYKLFKNLILDIADLEKLTL
jgi:hypothetical protein